jgi:hypothetical protein
MGLSEDVLVASTTGTMQFSYNLDQLFRVDAQVDALNLKMGHDSISTEAFYLHAEALKDTTSAIIRTGDLDFTFFTPTNAFNLMPKVEKLQKEATKQFKEHDVNLDVLKTYLPTISLHAKAGPNNPLSDVLRLYGIRCNDFAANIEASPQLGLTGNGHVCGFRKDSLRIDTAFFAITQDSTRLNYNVGVRCSDLPRLARWLLAG